MLLLNMECDAEEKSCEKNDRKFVAQWKSGLDVDAQVAAAAFFDLYENVSGALFSINRQGRLNWSSERMQHPEVGEV